MSYNLMNSIEADWDKINLVRDQLNKIPFDYSIEIYEYIKIVANELLENAIKYSSKMKGENLVEYDFQFEEKLIKLSVTNCIDNEEHLKFLKKFIDSISNENRIQSLYQERIDELFENKNLNHNRLGLLRIVAECNFDLKFYENKNTITLTAKKEL